MASPSDSPPLFRSVCDIISSLKNSPRSDINLELAQSELLAKEKHSRTNYDALEENHTSLRLQMLKLEDENRRLTRECEFKDHMVKVLKEKEAKSERLYQHAKADIEVLERKKDEYCRGFEEVRTCLMDRVRMLEDEVGSLTRVIVEKDGEIDDLKRFLSEKDGEMVVLRRKIEAFMKMAKDMERTMETIHKKWVDQCEISRSLSEDYRLEKGFIEEWDGVICGEIVGKIEELKKKLEFLKMEVKELVNENEQVIKKTEIENVCNNWIVYGSQCDGILSEDGELTQD